MSFFDFVLFKVAFYKDVFYKVKPFTQTPPKAIIRVLIVVSLIGLSAACSHKSPMVPAKVASPLGLYQSNTPQQFWLAILAENSYLLCSTKNCTKGHYESIPASYGVILLDFFKSDFGLQIERLSHGPGYSEVFYQQMKQIRLRQLRPDDLAFHVSDCGNVFCAGIGHRAEGVKFYQVTTFSHLPQTMTESLSQ